MLAIRNQVYFRGSFTNSHAIENDLSYSCTGHIPNNLKSRTVNFVEGENLVIHIGDKIEGLRTSYHSFKPILSEVIFL